MSLVQYNNIIFMQLHNIIMIMYHTDYIYHVQEIKHYIIINNY